MNYGAILFAFDPVLFAEIGMKRTNFLSNVTDPNAFSVTFKIVLTFRTSLLVTKKITLVMKFKILLTLRTEISLR